MTEIRVRRTGKPVTDDSSFAVSFGQTLKRIDTCHCHEGSASMQ
jgi:hypothetical protein